jgi:predicted nucleotidyltransferase component of viral defense system
MGSKVSSLKPMLTWKEYNCPLASLADLACMKLAAIAQRGSKKDFVDIYALGQETFSLTNMLTFYRRKYDVQDIGHILYGLSYFDQAEKERTPRMIWNVDWKEIRKTIQSWVKSFAG